jgi:membrane protein
MRALGARVYDRLWRDEIFDRAAGLSYYFLLALFPTLLFLTTLLGLLPGPRFMDDLMERAWRVMPPDAASLVTRTLAEVVEGASRGLLSIGVITALWAASSGVLSTMTALNVAFAVRDDRSWWERRLVALALTLGLTAFTLIALALVVFGERIGEALAGSLGLGDVFTATWNVVQWPVLVVCALAAINLLYDLAPAARRHWHWLSPGSVFAMAGWLVMSFALRAYVTYVANYNALYGSIGGVILLLLWLYGSGVVLLVGAEIDSEIVITQATHGDVRDRVGRATAELTT